MSTISCNCNDKTYPSVSSCSECSEQCVRHGGVESCYNVDNAKKIMGMTIELFLIIFLLYIIILVAMIYWSLYVLKKTGGKPSWLKPTIIVLFILWVIAFPISPLCFLALFIILFIFTYPTKLQLYQK